MSHNWRNVLISPDASIEEAINRIDQEALRVALVVDEQEHLLGTVSDGDVRRALIRHMPLSTPVRELMNRNPRVAELGTSQEALFSIMESNDLLSIPLVQDGVLVGLETLHHVLHRQRRENVVFLMAGGFGTRLRPLTNHRPKPLLNIGGKPILETILESFIASGFYRFYMSTHYMPDMIREHFGDGSNWGVEIEYIHEQEPLGTGGAMGLLPRDLSDLPLIVMNGDVLTKVDFEKLLDYHREVGASATICVREYEHQIPYGVIEAEGHRITQMVEKPVQKMFVNAGIYVVNPSIAAGVEQNTAIDMPTLLGQQMEQGELISMFPLHEYWLDIGRFEDLDQARVDIHGWDAPDEG